jgi:asparagine synthase (glutamine-hydrolysing)
VTFENRAQRNLLLSKTDQGIIQSDTANRTYDVITTTSVPMYLLQSYKKIRVKVVLSGEGADEILVGICILPMPLRRFSETIERVKKLFTADLLRADKAMMAHGVETRVPFLKIF